MSYHLLVTPFGLAPIEILTLITFINIFISFCQVKITECHLQIKSGQFLSDFHFKSALIDFWVFNSNYKESSSALWECGFREAESKSLWEVWGSQDGIHDFHNDGISTKLLLRDIV